MAAKGGKAHITLATGTETDTWRTDHIGSVEQLLKECPRGRSSHRTVWSWSIRGTHPDVGSILAAIALETEISQHAEHVGSILHVVVDGLLHLLLSFGRVNGLGSSLRDVAGAVELGTLAAQPQLVERDSFTLKSSHANFLRNNGIATANARESCGLGEGAELDGTLAGTTNLIDAVRNIGVLNVSLISRIEEDKGIVLQRIVHPLPQLLLGDDRACRIVRETEVNDIDRTTLRQFWNETVLCGSGHIAHVGPPTLPISATTSYHHVRVDIDRIDRIGNTDEVIPVQQFLKVSRVALGAIVDEHLVDAEAYATRCEVVLEDCLTQKLVSLLRTVSAEAL